MVYTFVTIKDNDLPVFLNKLGNKSIDFRLLLDTGCSLTTFYMDMELVKELYPDVDKANINVSMNSANGSVDDNIPVYKIRKFKLKDKDNNNLYIKDLHFIVSSASLNNIDIILSGNVFCSTDLSIIPVKDEVLVANRHIIVDTRRDDRAILEMKPYYDSAGKVIAYPTYLREIKK